MPPSFSVIIPCFNEARDIAATLKIIKDFFAKKAWPAEIIVVDDGSGDDTANLARASGAKVITNGVNRGKGYSVKVGITAAGGDYILFTDADLSTPITELEKLLKFLPEYDIAIGSRAAIGAKVTKNQIWPKVLFGKLGNKLIKLVLGLEINDTQCGFKLFKALAAKKIIEKQTLNRWGFDFELLLIAKIQSYKIKEVGVLWSNDPSSQVGFLDYVKTLGEVLKVKMNFWQKKYQ
ncbi:MAG: dolichyl-phosphate beta-glucosyltransferase [Patescibacteria group bacterium]|jgi:glycosyltransferase involved in cell wall biosynthesis